MSVVLELGSLGTPETEGMLSKPNFSLQHLCIVRYTGREKRSRPSPYLVNVPKI